MTPREHLTEMGFLKPPPQKADSPAPARKASIAYEGASYSRRAAGWQTSNYGPGSLVPNNANTLRARSRQLVRNNGTASNALDTFASEVIGTGITPHSQHPDPRIRRAINEAWLESTDESDADGLQDFYGQQTLLVRSIAEAGECFARFRPRRASDGLLVPLQVQGIEADLCPVEKTELLPDGRKIKAGIEFNAIENKVAYWMYRNHPGDAQLSLGSDFQTHRIPAREVMHCFKPLRWGQLRGQPHLTPVIVKLHELGAYDDAELARKKVAAMFAGFIKKNTPSDQPIQVTPDPGQTPQEAEAALVTRYITPLEPGLLQVLLEGWDVSWSAPADVGQQYEPFTKIQLKQIAAPLMVSYDQLSGDLTEVNYNSLRASLLTIRRKLEQFQHQIVVFQFCRPYWNRWIETAVLAGAIEGVSAADYNANPRMFRKVEWRSDAWAWVDPVKDAQAEKMLVRSGFKARQSVVNDLGDDVEHVDEQVEQDNARADEKGLIYDSDPRHTTASGGSGKTERVDAAGDAGQSQGGGAQPVNGRDRGEDAARVN